jgi:hypothetical protein
MADGAAPDEERCRMTPEGWRCPTWSWQRVTITQDSDPECDHRWLPRTAGPTTCVRCGATLPDTPKTENPNA